MSRPICLVHAAFCRPSWLRAASRGGPAGEVIVGTSLVHGLQQLGYEVVVLPSLRALAARLVAGRRRLRQPSEAWGRAGIIDFVVLDAWTLERARRFRVLGPADAHRVCVLDSFGLSPAARVARAPWLEAHRVLTPFATSFPWGVAGTFLGLLLPGHDGMPMADPAAARARARSCLEQKSPAGVLWAKEARYLHGPGWQALAIAAQAAPIHTTFREVGRLPPSLPPGVITGGHRAPTEWRALLTGARFLLGVGDPILGVAPLDALAAGCSVVIPGFDSPRLLAGDPVMPLTSQHPFLEALGPPFVHVVNLSDPGAVQGAVRDSLDADAVHQALSDGADNEWDRVVGALTLGPYVERLKTILSGMC